MSRHKLVKNLDLDEVLDDYDGAEDDNYDAEEVNAEDKERLAQGRGEVRATLGQNFEATDAEIDDSLYYYYYDVPKTINYLLNQKAKSNAKSEKAKQSALVKGLANNIGTSALHRLGFPCMCLATTSATDNGGSCRLSRRTISSSASLSQVTPKDFFLDAPWLAIPLCRQAEILIEPRHPYIGLLGGAPASDMGPPKSKLAALAAARKREKEEARERDSASNTVSADLLGKLRIAPSRSEAEAQHISRTLSNQSAKQHEPDRTPRKYSTKRQKGSPPQHEASENIVQASAPIPSHPPGPIRVQFPSMTQPSSFAIAMFGPNKMASIDTTLPDALVKDADAISVVRHMSTDIDPFSAPSPDDIVLKAQSTAKGDKGAKKSSITAKEIESQDVTKGVQNLSIAKETPKVKRKNIDVVAEYARAKRKNNVNFIVIGHVDAGKSTLMGRLLHDLKVVDQRTVDKYRKDAERMGKGSFALAWVLDQGTEERERGVTIDIANHQFETESTAFTILDAPGHQDFIPNMIAGASQADFALLVIDASTGSFESGLKGQTKEHALLVRSIGVQRLIVAVNKLDTIQWSRDRFDEISQQISAFLTAAGFLAKNISFLPCSGLTGDNIVHKPSHASVAWYSGPSLVELLETSEPVTRAITHPFRLTIDDVFRGGVQNPLSISGRIDSGTVQVGDSVLVVPELQTATIKGIEIDKESSEWAVAGQNTTLHLNDIDTKYLKAGDMICPPTDLVPCVTNFTVKLLAFEHVMPMHCEVLRGRLHQPGRITKLQCLLDKTTGQPSTSGTGSEPQKKPRLIAPGSVARVNVEVDSAIPLEHGNRVILRASGETIGAGLVEMET